MGCCMRGMAPGGSSGPCRSDCRRLGRTGAVSLPVELSSQMSRLGTLGVPISAGVPPAPGVTTIPVEAAPADGKSKAMLLVRHGAYTLGLQHAPGFPWQADETDLKCLGHRTYESSTRLALCARNLFKSRSAQPRTAGAGERVHAQITETMVSLVSLVFRHCRRDFVHRFMSERASRSDTGAAGDGPHRSGTGGMQKPNA